MATAQANVGKRRRIRVIVAHADATRRRAVRDALAGEPGIVVVADARNRVEAIELTGHYRPDVVLLSREFPGGDALGLAQRLAAWASGVVMVAGDPHDAAFGPAAMRAGASGVVDEQIGAPALGDALRAVAAGGAAISPPLAMRLVEELRRVSDGSGLRPVKSALTPREWEVLDLLCGGATTREIADALHLAEDTVYGHVKRMLRKLGVRSRAEAVSVAAGLRSVVRG